MSIYVLTKNGLPRLFSISKFCKLVVVCVCPLAAWCVSFLYFAPYSDSGRPGGVEERTTLVSKEIKMFETFTGFWPVLVRKVLTVVLLSSQPGFPTLLLTYLLPQQDVWNIKGLWLILERKVLYNSFLTTELWTLFLAWLLPSKIFGTFT